MKNNPLLLIGILVAITACSPLGISPTPSLQSPNEVTTLPSEEAPKITPGDELDDSVLTFENLKNYEYYAPTLKKSVKLSDGKMIDNAVTVEMLPQFALGELNGDGIEDAALLLAESGGGSGTFVSLLVIVSDQGEYKQLGGILIDDRPVISTLAINNGEITLQATIHRINDLMAEPTLVVRQTYRLLENNLTLMAQNSTLPGSQERLITISNPAGGVEISNPVQFTGRMPIAPFENNLQFTAYDLAGNVLYQSGFMVRSAEPGGPATFDNSMKVTNLASASTVRFELAELSMADGSLMTSSSVVVKIK